MERFEVVIANDGMQAEIVARPGEPPSKEQLAEVLKAAGVVHGIDVEAVERLCQPEAEGRSVIARGSVAQGGRDELLRVEEWHCKLPGKRGSAGKIDYHERQFLHPITTGQVLGSIQSSTTGAAGMDVRGRELAGTTGKPLQQRIGSGAVRKGNSIVANRDGVALVTDQLLDVVPLYTHSGDVDYSSGNLHTAGSLLIKGEVAEGFLVEAGGDIAVTGTVQGELHAKGSVMVERGVLGKQVVQAGADLTCHHATNGTLRAGGNLVVADQAAQCSMHAQSVLIIDGRAVVRGGLVCARDRIVVGSAGARAGTPTMLSVGQVFDERTEFVRRDAKAHRESRLNKSSSNRGRTSKSNRKLVKAADHALAEKLRLRRRQRELLREATIQVSNTCYGGVTIQFGPYHLEVDQDLHDVTFRFDLETDTIQYSTPKTRS